MAKDNTAGGLLPFGFQSLNPNKPNGFFDIFYSMGMPVYSRDTDTGYTNIYQNMFNRNLSRGVDPYTGFPEGWGGKAASPATPAPEAPAAPPAPSYTPPSLMLTPGLGDIGPDWRTTMMRSVYPMGFGY